MKKIGLPLLLIASSLGVTHSVNAKDHNYPTDIIVTNQNGLFKNGMYVQWGYNVEHYTNSNIHFKFSNGDNFTVHNAKAQDRPDFDNIYKTPKDITIPQYNLRIGFYLNPKKTKSLEINFDHTKYVVTDYQTVKVTGNINGQEVNQYMNLDPDNFLHFEHSDGANFLLINYVSHHTLLENDHKKVLTGLWKAGAGINIPRSDIRYKGDHLNNKFKVAGVNVAVEGDIRGYLTRHLFLEAGAKAGYARYINAAANTTALKGSRANHGFGYLEFIGTLGCDINWSRRAK